MSSTSDHRSSKSRNTCTEKGSNNFCRCPCLVNIILDLNCLDWYIKISGNTNHCYHTLVPLTHCSIGTKQLSTSMLDKINKLHKASISTAIQQNILFTNNNLTVDYQTILKKQASDRNAINKKLTNVEQLLDELKQ